MAPPFQHSGTRSHGQEQAPGGEGTRRESERQCCCRFRRFRRSAFSLQPAALINLELWLTARNVAWHGLREPRVRMTEGHSPIDPPSTGRFARSTARSSRVGRVDRRSGLCSVTGPPTETVAAGRDQVVLGDFLATSFAPSSPFTRLNRETSICSDLQTK